MKTDKGQTLPYGVVRFEEIIQECYIISKNIHTSYTDLLDITPREKNMMLELLNNEAKRQQELYDKQKAKMKR